MTPATPLAGLNVLDLTTVVAGPIASLTLAQQGAHITKVEPPGGDLVRRLGLQEEVPPELQSGHELRRWFHCGGVRYEVVD